MGELMVIHRRMCLHFIFYVTSTRACGTECLQIKFVEAAKRVELWSPGKTWDHSVIKSLAVIMLANL